MWKMWSGAAAGCALVLAGALAAGGHDRQARSAAVRPAVDRVGRLAVGYTDEGSLRHALEGVPAVVVRWIPALHVAELTTAAPEHTASTLRRAAGIRFVERPASRRSRFGPAPLAAPKHSGVEWQARVTHTDSVPATVLRAAATIRIAVIDTGADLTAPDLAAKTPEAYNTRTGDAEVRDVNGHGTFVASLAAGSVSDGDGIAGAGGDAQLLVVKSGTAAGAFTDVDEAAGIVYAVDHAANVINLSVGGPRTSLTEQRAIQYAAQHGVLLVAAVGNEYAAGNPVEYPAALLQPVGSRGGSSIGLAVTASTAGGLRAPFANTGSWVSLAAPGVDVFGAVSVDASTTRYPRSVLPGAHAGQYGYASGTSFAAPLVSGAAALVWAANPALGAADVARILEATASGRGRWTPTLGFGVIDVAAAVTRAQAFGTGDPPAAPLPPPGALRERG